MRWEFLICINEKLYVHMFIISCAWCYNENVLNFLKKCNINKSNLSNWIETWLNGHIGHMKSVQILYVLGALYKFFCQRNVRWLVRLAKASGCANIALIVALKKLCGWRSSGVKGSARFYIRQSWIPFVIRLVSYYSL